MQTTTPLGISLIVCAGLTAQQNYHVSPPGTESLEGGGTSSIQLNYANSRVQQIDNSLVGSKLRLIRGLAYKRNGGVVATAIATIEIEILMTHSDFAKITSTYANNYKVAPTTVFTKKKIKIDWTRSIPAPAPYDAVFPLDKPFIYNGTDALLWDSKTTTGTTGPGLTQDWWNGTSPATIYGPIPSALGAGCKTSNGTMTLSSSFRSSTPTGFDFAWSITGGPSSQPALLIFGLGAATVPLFCGNLEISQPIVILPYGTTSATGSIPLNHASSTWNPNLKEADIYTQMLALDPTQKSGFALSNGLHSRIPRQPGGAAPYDIKRIYSTTSSTALTGSTPTLTSIAVKYLH